MRQFEWRTIVLFLATCGGVALVFTVFLPFLPSVIWAIALKVATERPYRWLARKLKRPGLSAAIGLILIILVVLVPTVVIGQQLAQQLIEAARLIQSGQAQDWILSTLGRYPRVEHYIDQASGVVNLRQAAQGMGGFFASKLQAILTTSVSTVTKVVLMLFTLFFLFRDGHHALRFLKACVPLDDSETDYLMQRLENTISATVQGSLTIAAIQGCLGGIMFRILSVPNALMWSVVMALCATIPSLGTFLVWAPTAVYLAITGSWIKAIILTAWGSLVIGTVDNFLYPTLVGSKLQLHTVPVLFSVLGGIGLFGITGIVLGPMLLSTTVTLLQFWNPRLKAIRNDSD